MTAIDRLRTHCFRLYRHGCRSPWTCPECGQVWTVENRQWVPGVAQGGTS